MAKKPDVVFKVSRNPEDAVQYGWKNTSNKVLLVLARHLGRLGIYLDGPSPPADFECVISILDSCVQIVTKYKDLDDFPLLLLESDGKDHFLVSELFRNYLFLLTLH